MAKANIKPFTIIEDKVAADFAYPVYEAYLKAKESGEQTLIAQTRAAIKSLLKVDLKVDPKTQQPKVYNGVMYLNIKFNINGNYVDGWFRITEELEIRGMADPSNKQDKRNEHEGTRLTFETNKSKAGHIGRYLTAINESWLIHVQDLVEAKKFILGKRGVKPLMQTHYGDSNITKAGQPMDDPPIRFSLSKTKFPEKYPLEFLQGKPETEIFDASRPYTTPTGAIGHPSPTVTVNGKETLMDWNNIHQFVRHGSKLMPRSIVNLPSASVSQAWVAVMMMMHRGIVMPPPTYGGFDDDFAQYNPQSFTDTITTQNTLNASTVPTVNTNSTATTVNPTSPQNDDNGAQPAPPSINADALAQLLSSVVQL